ncbi:lysylphosphatidylglycerol synthase transmembrane domain-containing protein [Larkinella sp. VNQ87]|uniref:lysylphosphatidylglycerol synthase transmembrane domain-containing protein n=1 Tax=Larkinella sp. VNQ87 TaxID=3400921 RepID=UPI003C0F9156
MPQIIGGLPNLPPFRTDLIRRLFKQLVPIALALALLAYALKDISFAQIGQQFRQARYGWIALVALLTVLLFLVRGKRWQLPLLALGYAPTVFRTTVATMAGVIASMIVPGSGELTRCATLQRTDQVPFSQGVGSVVAERVIDLLMLLLLLLLTFLLELNRMQTYLAGLSFRWPTTTAWALGIGTLLVAGAGGWYLFRNETFREHPIIAKLANTVKGLWQGFFAIRQVQKLYLFVLLTLLNQALSWLSTYWLLMALDSTRALPPTAALTILAVSSLGGLAVPTQGGIGTYHFFVSRALVLYGFTPAEGAIVATFLHAVGFAINLLLSSLSFLLVPFLLTNNRVGSENSAV